MNKINIKISLSQDESQLGIWRFNSYFSSVPEKFRLSLEEGNTPEIEFEEGLFLKREDQNPTGSLKDRGMAYLISKVAQLEQKNLVCPSSGNAAISASSYCKLANINLTVFISPKTDRGKLQVLKDQNVEIMVSGRPISDSIKYAKEKNYYNIRPSQNVYGPEGYQTIAFEIIQNLGMIDDLFIPVSSGVALVGITEGFKKMKLMPRIHVCQPASVCPIASIFDKNFLPEKDSLATALVARTSPLSERIAEIVRESLGNGWVISNSEIEFANKTLETKSVSTSYEGALALAAVYKAKKAGQSLGKTVCLLTGKKY